MTWLSPKNVSIDVLIAHLPSGKAWNGFRITGKTAHKFWRGLARTHQTTWAFLASLATKIDYRTSDEMLVEWETAVGIPDPCLPRGATLAERRSWIKFRLDKKRWNTLQDWRDLATMFGLQVRIVPGYVVQRPSLYASIFPIPIRVFPKLGRFRVYIDILNDDFGGFPYDGTSIEDHRFPIPFSVPDGIFGQYRCIIERVAPANVLIIWNDFPAVPPNGTGFTFTADFDEEFS